jgi:hypothetical protein
MALKRASNHQKEGCTMRQDNRIIEAVIIAFLLACSLLWASRAWSAEVVDVGRLADAIYKAENSKSNPYGIMRDYCHAGAEAQCRKGCVQTIQKWAKRLEYSDMEGFLRQFAEIYAPTHGKTLRKAEREKNPNWYRNVLTFYNASL